MTINIDFDSTCVTHEYPEKKLDIGSAEILRRLVQNGHKLILFTCRGNKLHKDKHGKIHTGNLDEAIAWFKENDISLYGIQTNPKQKKWTDSPKSHADLMIDDTAIGCPLIYNEAYSERPFVDWKEIEKYLIRRGLI